VPREAEQDTQLQYALKMLRGEPLPQLPLPPQTTPSGGEASAPKAPQQ